MAAGIVSIIAGILIAIFPDLLSLIVAAFLIFWGIFFIALSRHFKKMSRRFEDPFIDFFFRY